MLEAAPSICSPQRAACRPTLLMPREAMRRLTFKSGSLSRVFSRMFARVFVNQPRTRWRGLSCGTQSTDGDGTAGGLALSSPQSRNQDYNPLALKSTGDYSTSFRLVQWLFLWVVEALGAPGHFADAGLATTEHQHQGNTTTTMTTITVTVTVTVKVTMAVTTITTTTTTTILAAAADTINVPKNFSTVLLPTTRKHFNKDWEMFSIKWVLHVGDGAGHW